MVAVSCIAWLGRWRGGDPPARLGSTDEIRHANRSDAADLVWLIASKVTKDAPEQQRNLPWPKTFATEVSAELELGQIDVKLSCERLKQKRRVVAINAHIAEQRRLRSDLRERVAGLRGYETGNLFERAGHVVQLTA